MSKTPLQQQSGTFKGTWKQLQHLNTLLEDHEAVASFSWWPVNEDVNPAFLAQHCEDVAALNLQQNQVETWGFEIHVWPCDTFDFSNLSEQLGLSQVTLRSTPVPEKDWLAENFKAFQAIEIGNFYIHGSHESPSLLSPQQQTICLDAATAFGSGRHETTAACLRLVEDLAIQAPWKKALDLGCGSGLLAIAMAMLCPVPTWASDIDEQAVAVAWQNAKRNKVETYLHCLKSDGVASPALQQEAPFQVVVANILAGPLMQLAPDLAPMVAPGGHLILSGFLKSQETELLDIYLSLGFELAQRIQDGDWVAVCLKKI